MLLCACFQCLKQISDVLPCVEDDYDVGMSVAKRLWISCNDVDETVNVLAVE